MSEMQWLDPWQPIELDAHITAITNELYSELGAQHQLHGVKARAVARRQDNDDTLFQLLDGSGRFAVVHLTYAQHPEPDPRWPYTEIFSDWLEFEQTRMRPDAL